MRVLLTVIGSRGDVQPILALALALRELGHGARLVAPPNFKDWIESYGLECVPVGPDVQKLSGGTVPGKPVMPSPEALQKMADESVREQFRVIGAAAEGCDGILAATALQFAARSVAEARGLPYVFAAYCPAVLPSPSYPPTRTGGFYPQGLPAAENLRLWDENEASFRKFAPAINAERAKIVLPPIQSVRDHMFTARPWLAADPTLAPADPAPGLEIVQTGPWVVPDERALPDDLEGFLAAGAPPVYLGFGSMRESDQTGRALVDAVRALGLRAVISQGWAGLAPADAGADCFSVGEVNYERLFPRVAAVVHHGGAGTTHAAARAAAPQVIVPHHYDQFYFAHRVTQLGAGVTGPQRDDLTAAALADSLRACLRPQVAAQARALSAHIVRDGARRAAERLVGEWGT